MRSKITILIILIAIIVLTYVAIEGIKIKDFQILSISQLIEKNNELNVKITEASELTTTSYPEKIAILEETYEKYQIQKQKYEELVGVTNKNNDEIYETKQYDIGYLWRILGNYAKKRNVNLGIEVQKNSFGQSSYNINFTVSGKYVNTSQFVTDIENESDLYFRIYNFKMTGGVVADENNELGIIATFTVRNVNLDPSTIS